MGDFSRIATGIASLVAGARTLRGVVEDRRKRRREASPRLEDAPTVTTHPVWSIDDRIKHIRTQIRKGGMDGRVRQTASAITSKKCGRRWCVDEKDWHGEVVAVFNAVRSQVRYTLDFYRADTYQHPRRILETRAGDCDDYVILLASLLQSIGYPVKMRVVQTAANASWDHIYLLVGLPPQRPTHWMALDASVAKPAGWEVSDRLITRKRDFDV